MNTCIKNQTYQYCSPTLKLKLPPYSSSYSETNFMCANLDQSETIVQVLHPYEFYASSFQNKSVARELWVKSCDYNAMGLYDFQVIIT